MCTTFIKYVSRLIFMNICDIVFCVTFVNHPLRLRYRQQMQSTHYLLRSQLEVYNF